MITLTHIASSPALALFVRHYQLLEFDTNDLELLRPWHAGPEVHIVFFLKDKPIIRSINRLTKDLQLKSYSVIKKEVETTLVQKIICKN